MILRPGSILKGAQATYQILQTLKADTILEINRSKCIRRLYDAVGSFDIPCQTFQAAGYTGQPRSCLVFERMETDLWHVPSKPFCGGGEMSKVVNRSVLEALDVFRKLSTAHTGVLEIRRWRAGSKAIKESPMRKRLQSLLVELPRCGNGAQTYGPWASRQAPRISDPSVLSSLIEFIVSLLVVDPNKRPTGGRGSLQHGVLAPRWVDRR
ncbi:hypothetical protein CHU98_g9831 [Xylaria longipes]|nr:hypothetical protein CHU98_g9831 [Xylaria longipes]